MSARGRVMTPAEGRGAIACVRLVGTEGEVARVLAAAGAEGVAVGRARVRWVFGLDEAVVVRWGPGLCDVMPHGGRAIVRRVVDGLEAAGAVFGAGALDAGTVEDRLAEVLPWAASPAAVDLLLDQPRRWHGLDPDDPGVDVADGPVLARLVDPPLVAAIGAPSVGKSTLANAWAGRTVSLVHEAPGTTRDHVGVSLELDGVAVRYLDTPGVGEDADPLTVRAVRAAMVAAAGAPVVLACGDAWRAPPSGAWGLGGVVVRVALREDLGRVAWEADARVSVREGWGVDELARRVRRALVPDAAIADPRPWRFWGAGASAAIGRGWR